MLYCIYPGDYNSERIFKIGQYLTKLCVEHLGFTFFGPPCIVRALYHVQFRRPVGQELNATSLSENLASRSGRWFPPFVGCHVRCVDRRCTAGQKSFAWSRLDSITRTFSRFYQRELNYLKVGGGTLHFLPSFLPFHSFPSFPIPFPSLPSFPSLLSEVGPLNPCRPIAA